MATLCICTAASRLLASSTSKSFNVLYYFRARNDGVELGLQFILSLIFLAQLEPSTPAACTAEVDSEMRTH